MIAYLVGLNQPILRGWDIKRYNYKFADKRLIFIPWCFPLYNYSTIKRASKKAEESFKINYSAIYNHLFIYKEKISQ